MEHLTADAFQLAFDVPRGTMDKLTRYTELLASWQEKMNLVGPATLSDIWGRHFADSAQLLRHSPSGSRWLDIGAGGGFPGMLLGILGAGPVVLAESIAKKVRFLEAVRDELGLQQRVSVLHGRIEDLPAQCVDVVTARAVAPLKQLMEWGLPHVRPGGLLLFPKGRRWAEEVAQAKEGFSFDLSALPSITDADARILRLEKIKRR